jgi:hypothetical protein
MRTSLIAWPLGWLLHHATAGPPLTQRERFYTLKGRLLRTSGRLIGDDWQHMVKACWDGPCSRCSGTGSSDEFWVALERWALGRFVFHRPISRTHTAPTVPVTIEGDLRHADPGPVATECALWLAFAFDRTLCWAILLGPGDPTWSWWPLGMVQQLSAWARRAWHRDGPRRCEDCGRPFLRVGRDARPWTAWRCCSCDHIRGLADVPEDLPF